MSNLGDYQLITTLSKKVGGPRRLVGIIIGSTIVLDRVAIFLHHKYKKKKTVNAAKKVYSILHTRESDDGVVFKKGDLFRVIETDGDVCLVDRLGDKNSPYYVSGSFLGTISDYKHHS